MEKFKALPNPIYTDGNEWGLQCSGKPWLSRTRRLSSWFSGDITTDGVDVISTATSTSLTNCYSLSLTGSPSFWQAAQLAEDAGATLPFIERGCSRDRHMIRISQLADEWRQFPFQTRTTLALQMCAPDAHLCIVARPLEQRNKFADRICRPISRQRPWPTGSNPAKSYSPTPWQEIEVAVDLLTRATAVVRTSLWRVIHGLFSAKTSGGLRSQTLQRSARSHTPPAVIGAQVRLAAELQRVHRKRGSADDGVIIFRSISGRHCRHPPPPEYAPARPHVFGEDSSATANAAKIFTPFENMVGPCRPISACADYESW